MIAVVEIKNGYRNTRTAHFFAQKLKIAQSAQSQGMSIFKSNCEIF